MNRLPKAPIAECPDTTRPGLDTPFTRYGDVHIPPLSTDSSIHDAEVTAFMRELQVDVEDWHYPKGQRVLRAIGSGAVMCTFLETPLYTGEL